MEVHNLCLVIKNQSKHKVKKNHKFNKRIKKIKIKQPKMDLKFFIKNKIHKNNYQLQIIIIKNIIVKIKIKKN